MLLVCQEPWNSAALRRIDNTTESFLGKKAVELVRAPDNIFVPAEKTTDDLCSNGSLDISN